VHPPLQRLITRTEICQIKIKRYADLKYFKEILTKIQQAYSAKR